MKKFEFSLQKILDLRCFEKQQAEADLGKTLAEIESLKEKLKSIAAQRINVGSQQEGSMNMNLYMQTDSYFTFLREKENLFLEEIAQKELVAEKKREVLRQAMKKVKALEKLRDKKKEEYKLEVKRQEEKANDNIVTAMTFRKSNT